MTEYLTTQELADLLRIKQRKVYDLAASGQVPCSRAMGKLLFPRAEIEAWVAAGGIGFAASGGAAAQSAPAKDRALVFLGSHDPLLDWALRQSRAGIASYFDGSLDGLERFAAGEGVATSLHIFDPAAGADDGDDDDAWNKAAVAARFARQPVVLVEFAWRERGLIVQPHNLNKFKTVADLRGHLIVPRQAEAGSQALLDHMLKAAGLGEYDYVYATPARTETDAAQTVAEDLAEAALGLRGVADQLRLGFRPLVRERFDLLVDRKAWFDPPFQRFLAFCRTDEFHAKALAMKGYDVEGLGTVHFNGA